MPETFVKVLDQLLKNCRRLYKLYFKRDGQTDRWIRVKHNAPTIQGGGGGGVGMGLFPC